ncbi:MAG: bifunctional nicotinamidase/pyrazinamidase [Candidatus Heimdallarchaeota archaeon]|nr:MAG: bifunctional nicotinamidase/pyrazinamidase [Candidatus Heimdallarchaeota archaeon]
MQIEEVELAGFVKITSKDALLVVDMQNDFVPGGTLPVADGDQIVPGINDLTDRFHQTENPIIFTQDWHPVDHHSFASTYPEKEPYDPLEAPGIGPILWPDHCVQGTHGANFVPGLQTANATLILRKGFHKTIDSYSAFLENDKITETGLSTFLQTLGIERIFVCGLALDYCVYNTVIDAKKFGFDVITVLDLTKAVNAPEDSVLNALKDMIEKDIVFVTSDKILL